MAEAMSEQKPHHLRIGHTVSLYQVFVEKKVDIFFQDARP